MNISAKESGGCYELKQYKSRFDEECLTFFFLKKKSMQAALQRLQGPSQINGDNPDSERRESNRHFRR
jgi:hypothetical protein